MKEQTLMDAAAEARLSALEDRVAALENAPKRGRKPKAEEIPVEEPTLLEGDQGQPVPQPEEPVTEEEPAAEEPVAEEPAVEEPATEETPTEEAPAEPVAE